jgi:hypothetical protein
MKFTFSSIGVDKLRKKGGYSDRALPDLSELTDGRMNYQELANKLAQLRPKIIHSTMQVSQVQRDKQTTAKLNNSSNKIRLVKPPFNIYSKSPKYSDKSIDTSIREKLKQFKKTIRYPVKHKIFEKDLKDELFSDNEAEYKIEDEYSAMKIGDKVELVKNFLVPPRIKPAMLDKTVKLYSRNLPIEKSKTIKLCTLLSEEERKANQDTVDDLEMVNIGGIVQYRRKRTAKMLKKDFSTNRTLHKKNLSRTFNFGDNTTAEKLRETLKLPIIN